MIIRATGRGGLLSGTEFGGTIRTVQAQLHWSERRVRSLFKTYTIRESLHLQIRAETFNFLNHTNFQDVATALGGSDGIIAFGVGSK